ncbi:hypothetical protein O181_012764 [Austropuccinia psidii MF-1]|uniref:Uncharacterized protein n=1 Tax=Austropuccinia psidii MF-1 TaxID=1389203 RepID=A0A9Q3GN67_9BASI|nr:hypothetical protein [Austropuccinia psidii MF-1]
MDPLSTHILWKPPAEVQQGFPSIQGKTFSSLMDAIPKDSGMVHIWYNIPLCIIFLQQSNGDVFRTQLHHFNFSPKIHHPFQGKTFQTLSLAIHDGYQKTIGGPQTPGPVGFGLLFHFRIVQGVISRVYQSFNQLSRHQPSQYSLDNSIGPHRLYSRNLYVLGPFDPFHI